MFADNFKDIYKSLKPYLENFLWVEQCHYHMIFFVYNKYDFVFYQKYT